MPLSLYIPHHHHCSKHHPFHFYMFYVLNPFSSAPSSHTHSYSTMPRHDSFSDSPRPTRPTYLPPHLRASSHFSDSPRRFSRSPRGGGRGGRGGSRGGGGGSASGRGPTRSRSWFRSPRDGAGGSVCPSAVPFDDVSEKLDGLKVEDDEEVVEAAANMDAYDDSKVEATGENIPPPVTSFSDVDFPKALMDNIRRCKYVKPTPIQRYAIPVAMAGRDLMACAQTGSGKTAAFCFPIISGILKLNGRGGFTGSPARVLSKVAFPFALVLTPTRELSCQIQEEATKFSYHTGLKVVVAYGGAPMVQQLRNLEKGVDILVATPGRLLDMIERSKVSLEKVKYLALDEADRMLDMGFEPQIRRIVEQMAMPPPGERQTMLFSATFPTEIQRLAADFLTNYIFLTAGRVGSSTHLIVQKVEFVYDADKRYHLMNLLDTHKANGTYGTVRLPRDQALTLVFVETKRGADALEHWLTMKGFPSIAIHGGKVQMERERALRNFKNGLTPTMVATDVASRGLDIPHVAHVINFDLPKDIDDYVHRIGRTGRAGKSGLATAFFSEKNLPLAKDLVELMVEANQEVPDWLNQYAKTLHGTGHVSVRGSRYGNRKFGGRDYRTSAYLGNENDNYSSQNGDVDAYADSFAITSDYASPPDIQHSAAGSSSFAVAPYGYGLGYGTVATGWD